MDDDARNLGHLYACASEAEALATHAQVGGTIAVGRYGRRRVWSVWVPQLPAAS
jgi:hypothetical protein